ncbi:class I SAM-dependent methyltransferase [Cyanobacteria bacterium FACHB-63]|nr:class I SAM-dependent methyltransferase [Cyanobacteria bacterium FACHB-63]
MLHLLSHKFEHRKVPDHILGDGKILDIGCGRSKLEGAIGLDHVQFPGVDIVADLNQPLPIEDATFDAVHADQVLEHVDNLVGLIYEVHRILKPGGVFLATVPYFRSAWAYIDPTHVRCFTLYSMNYYVKGTREYEYYRFQDEAFSSVEIFLDSTFPSTTSRKVFSSLALRNPVKFENSILSSLYPFQHLSFLLRKGESE